jgi:hypothetical protein
LGSPPSSGLVWSESLSASAESVGVGQNFRNVGRELVELGESDNEVASVPVSDFELDKIASSFESCNLFGKRVELDGLVESGMLTHDDSDKIFVLAFNARYVRYTN